MGNNKAHPAPARHFTYAIRVDPIDGERESNRNVIVFSLPQISGLVPKFAQTTNSDLLY